MHCHMCIGCSGLGEDSRGLEVAFGVVGPSCWIGYVARAVIGMVSLNLADSAPR